MLRIRIKLLRDLRVNEKHGMAEGRVLEVVALQTRKGRDLPKWYVVGDAGTKVGVMKHEAEKLPC